MVVELALLKLVSVWLPVLVQVLLGALPRMESLTLPCQSQSSRARRLMPTRPLLLVTLLASQLALRCDVKEGEQAVMVAVMEPAPEASESPVASRAWMKLALWIPSSIEPEDKPERPQLSLLQLQGVARALPCV